MRPTVYLIAVCLAGAVVRGTVLLPAEVREIVTGSEIIAYGRVIDASALLSDDRKHVDTLVTLQVATYLKGGPGETLTFKVPGGQIGRYRSVMVGAPVFETGDEVVLFLKSGRGPVPHIFGLNQGVFRVRLDAQTARRVVVSPPLIARGEAAELVVRGSPERRAMPLETFGAQVRSVLAEAAAAAGAR
jgi:hypothetical protein